MMKTFEPFVKPFVTSVIMPDALNHRGHEGFHKGLKGV